MSEAYPIRCTITEVQVREIANELGISAADLEASMFRHLGLGFVTHGTKNAYSMGCKCDLCMTVGRAYDRKQRAGLQAETLDRATRHRSQWTGQELEIAARTDLTVREIALMLNRSYKAVATKRERLRREPKLQKAAGVSALNA